VVCGDDGAAIVKAAASQMERHILDSLVTSGGDLLDWPVESSDPENFDGQRSGAANSTCQRDAGATSPDQQTQVNSFLAACFRCAFVV